MKCLSSTRQIIFENSLQYSLNIMLYVPPQLYIFIYIYHIYSRYFFVASTLNLNMISMHWRTKILPVPPGKLAHGFCGCCAMTRCVAHIKPNNVTRAVMRFVLFRSHFNFYHIP